MSVFTPVSADQLAVFLQHYDVGTLQHYTGISAGVENTNFFVSTSEGEFVLTLFEKYAQEQLGYFIELMEYLFTHAIPTPKPIGARQGDGILTLNGRPATLFTRLPGESVLVPERTHCAQIGRFLARMHLAGQHFKRYRHTDRGNQWRMRTTRQLLPELTTVDADLLVAEMREQNLIPWKRLPRGVIHADLFRDNALFDGQQLTGIIDWYFACYDCWLYDLAVVVNDWCCDESGQLDQVRLLATLNAYHQIRPLLPLEQQYWSSMLRAAAIRFWLSRLLDVLTPRSGEMVLQKDPLECRDKLRQRIAEEELIRHCWPQGN